MIAHLHDTPRKPSRAVVLGAGGFIGGAVARRLRSDGIEVAALGRSSCDLLAPDAATRLAAELRPNDTLIFVSARAPVKNVAMLMENICMGEAVCAALKERPVAHVVYVSSDAVYKDSAEPLSESSCAELWQPSRRDAPDARGDAGAERIFRASCFCSPDAHLWHRRSAQRLRPKSFRRLASEREDHRSFLRRG